MNLTIKHSYVERKVTSVMLMINFVLLYNAHGLQANAIRRRRRGDNFYIVLFSDLHRLITFSDIFNVKILEEEKSETE